MNARQVFAPFRGPEQQRRFGLSLDGPIWKNHTSLFLNAEGSLFFDARPIFATTAQRNVLRSRVPAFKTIKSRRAYRTRTYKNTHVAISVSTQRRTCRTISASAISICPRVVIRRNRPNTSHVSAIQASSARSFSTKRACRHVGSRPKRAR